MEIDARALEDVGDLRHRAGAAMRQPFAGHRRAIAHAVERGVVDGARRLQVEDDDRNPGAPDHREDRRRQRIGRDVKEDQIDVFLSKAVPCLEGFGRAVDQTEIHHLDAGPGEPLGHPLHVALQSLLQPGKLRPVRIEPDAEQANPYGSHQRRPIGRGSGRPGAKTRPLRCRHCPGLRPRTRAACGAPGRRSSAST